MFIASIQTESGQSLFVRRPDGWVGGKSILSFVLAALSYCDARTKGADASPALKEFDRIPDGVRRSLCLASAQLMQALINSQWDYQEGEDYQSYVSRTHDAALSEKAFLVGAGHYQQAWTDIDLLIARAQTIIAILYQVYLPDDAQYLAYDVLVEFIALHKALLTLWQAGAQRARIDIH